MEQQLRRRLRHLIQKNLISFDEEVSFSDSENIFTNGYVNSLFAMKLLTFVETELDVEFENDELELSNFSSIDNIIKLAELKKGVPL